MLRDSGSNNLYGSGPLLVADILTAYANIPTLKYNLHGRIELTFWEICFRYNVHTYNNKFPVEACYLIYELGSDI